MKIYSSDFPIILVHYSEIALKGKNRQFFENKLIENIKAHLKPVGHFNIEKLHDRILIFLSVETPTKTKQFPNIPISQYLNILKNIFGIANFSLAYQTKLDLNAIKKQTLSLCAPVFKLGKKTFAIDAERSNKKFPLTSQQIEQQLGTYILQNYNRSPSSSHFSSPDSSHKSVNDGPRKSVNDGPPGPSHAVVTDGPPGPSRQHAKEYQSSHKPIKVNLTNPDFTIHVEILKNQTLIYTKKIPGLSGLPTSTSGKIISLISGGIDSPVASYLLMKRGCKIIFTHFHSYPQTSQESIAQVKKLIKILNQYQLNSKLYLIPLLNIQKQIIANCSQKLRVILYRRMMIHLANSIAQKENAKALVTGDSIGQVASQTLENIYAISQASNLPILRPLAGFNKQEIIDLAKKINTYQISIQPFPDCCSLFVPKHPETKAKIIDIIQNEKLLNINVLLENAMETTQSINF